MAHIWVCLFYMGRKGDCESRDLSLYAFVYRREPGHSKIALRPDSPYLNVTSVAEGRQLLHDLPTLADDSDAKLILEVYCSHKKKGKFGNSHAISVIDV